MANARNLSTLAQGASTAGVLDGAYGGNVALAGTLDMIRITNTATGTNSFDAGSINIFYE